MGEKPKKATATDSYRLLLAIVLFTAGAVILFVRFPPADLAGWIAQSLHVTLGVPYLGAAALFGGAVWLIRDTGRYKAFRIISFTAACIALVAGLSLVATPV